MSERTALYRAFDAEDALLYVGISKNFGARWQHHAAVQAWWPLVQRQTVDWYEDRDSAHVAEVAAISDEHPRFNVIHVPKSAKPERLPVLLPPGPAGPGKWVSTSEAARMTDPPTTRFTVEREIERGLLVADKAGRTWVISYEEACRWAKAFVPYRTQRLSFRRDP